MQVVYLGSDSRKDEGGPGVKTKGRDRGSREKQGCIVDLATAMVDRCLINAS